MDEPIVVTEAMRRAVYADDCLLSGHQYDIIIGMDGEPVSLTCGRCGANWHVAGRAGS